MRLDEKDYLKRRACEERLWVGRSTHRAQRRAHLALARAYEARLSLLDRFGTAAANPAADRLEASLPRPPLHRLRIVPEDEQDLAYWGSRFDVGRAELLRAIAGVGTRLDRLMGALQRGRRVP